MTDRLQEQTSGGFITSDGLYSQFIANVQAMYRQCMEHLLAIYGIVWTVYGPDSFSSVCKKQEKKK